MRESMPFDVVIVGAGPAGLSTACRLMQEAKQAEQEVSICVVEKGSEVGAHILSGAILEPRSLNELFPDWKERGAPLNTPVTSDEIYLFQDAQSSKKIPNSFVPKTMHNEGNYIISLGSLCRWLAEQAEEMGVEIFPGFSASEILYDSSGAVMGVATGDMGVGADGQPKDGYMEGMELHAKYTVFSEGCRGHLGKQLLEKYNLNAEADVQHYALGIKEIWDVEPEKHQPGLVVHGAGWPLDQENNGGSFLYHGDNNQVMVGIVVDLNYANPHLSPFEEFQRMKHHPVFKDTLEGGRRVSYGARAIAKGGLNALPKMYFPGGLLVGCDAGTLNFAKIKGTHTAMKSGMLAAEVIFERLQNDDEGGQELASFAEAFNSSWIYEELHSTRNFGPAMHKFGTFWGGAFNYIDQNWFKGRLPFTLRDNTADHTHLKDASECQPINYEKPDGILSFDKLSSVYLSNTNHEEDQPCHLQLKDQQVAIDINWGKYSGPEARFCPAGVYEFVQDAEEEQPKLQINAQNCIHCKTCDIKDPTQNITWVTPEGAGGPNYPNM